MRLVNLLAGLATTGLLLGTNAFAESITFHVTIPGATGSNNGVPFTDQTVTITVQADTSQVTSVANIADSGDPGNCVPATSTLISVGGAPPLEAVAPMYFCATLTALITGVFTTADAAPDSWYFIADYSNAGMTDYALASNFPPTTNVQDDTAATTTPLNLAGGGTASLTTVPLAGTTFSATLGVASGVPTPVPTLGEVGLAALAVLLALAGLAGLAALRKQKLS